MVRNWNAIHKHTQQKAIKYLNKKNWSVVFFVIFFRHKQRRKWTKIYNWYEEREPNRHDTKQPISTIYIRWQTKNVSVFICFITAFFSPTFPTFFVHMKLICVSVWLCLWYESVCDFNLSGCNAIYFVMS